MAHGFASCSDRRLLGGLDTMEELGYADVLSSGIFVGKTE